LAQAPAFMPALARSREIVVAGVLRLGFWQHCDDSGVAKRCSEIRDKRDAPYVVLRLKFLR